jgi:hypothetical protein
LVLGHAVERAEAEDQIAASDAHDFAVRKKTRQHVQSHAVV